MTPSTRWTGELRRIATRAAPPSDESAAVVGRRKFVVAAVLLVGAALLGYSLSRPPGDDTFIWLTLALAERLPMRLDTLVLDFKAGTLSCVYRIHVAAQFGPRVLEIRSGRAPI